ncbi:T9SS C-terminal target domain-containing protein, partial [Lacihabitans sp. LS3-19]|uniref:T9SS type A sorting domain-containing protein n=1 Tax=Lacihabitans sp. LS3-19 TaxID=2487335 RepID=UPI0020CF08A2
IDTAIGSGISSVALNVPPIAACTPLTVSIGSNCQATVTAAQIGAGSSDPNGDDITYSISPVGPFGVGVYNISLTVTDIYGSSSTCTNTLTVVDNQAPVVRLKDAVINLSSDGIAALTLAQINDGITDNCNISSIELSKTQFGCDNMGKNLVSVSVKDAAGNQTTQWCTVTVLDVTAPQVSTKNAVIFLNFDGYATLNPEDIDFGTFDKCSVHKLSLSKSVFSCENVGFNSVDLIATDASGNVSKASAVVKVVDNTLPYQSSKKLEIELDKGAELILDKNTPNLNIYDACGLKSIDIISEIITCETKSKTVNIRATDKNDNVLVTDLSLVVKDTKFPVIITKPAKLYLDASGQAILKATALDNGSTDNCKIDSMYVSKSTFTCENIGNDSVTFFAKDNYGNVSMKKEAITVIDSMAPSIITKDFTVILDAEGKGILKVEDIDNGSTDNCGIKSRTLSKTSFDCTNAGKVEVTYTVEDNNGNKAEKKLQITIAESTKPTLKLKDNLTFGLDKDGFVKLTAAEVVAEATDNCGIKQTTLSKESFNCSNIGKNDVTITLTDNSGNITTATASINITDNQGNCLCSYAMLASERIEVNGSAIEYGGLGTYQAGKTVNLSKSTFGPTNVFVKSDVLVADTQPSLVIKGIAPTPLAFEANDKSTRKKLKVKNGKEGSFSENDFGKVKVGKNATLTYTGSGDVYFKTLKIKKGGKLNFEQSAKVHIKTYTRFNQEITINEGQENVKIFTAKNVGIEMGSQINAYLHSQAGIEIKNADANKKTTINGILIASKIKSGSNVVLKGQPTDCSNTAVVGTEEDSLISKNESKEIEKIESLIPEPKNYEIKIGPNPTKGEFNIIFYGKDVQILDVKVFNILGNEIDIYGFKLLENGMCFNFDKLNNGMYFISLNTGEKVEKFKIYLQK